MKPRILYAGDSPLGGPANYLLGILRHLGAKTTHLSPSDRLTSEILRSEKYDAIILSDYSKKQLSTPVESQMASLVQRGTGLLMVGGWGSFSGPFGGWAGSRTEQLLPVTCLRSDDRTNFPGGATLKVKVNHAILRGLNFNPAPAICGMNRLIPKSQSQTVLVVRRILSNGQKISFEKGEYPLLVLGSDASTRVAALATDLAPHWCGGLVDWGTRLTKIPVAPGIQIQVGDQYIRFVSALIQWLIKL